MSSSLSRLNILFLLCFLSHLFVSNINACSYAYQYSLFPLGSSAGQIIFLELELERYVNTPAGSIGMIRPNERSLPNDVATIETRWKGNIRLKRQARSLTAMELIEELAYIDISDENYKAALAPYFEKALQKAYELPFFEEAFLEEIAYCKYDRSCNLFTLKIDSSNVNLTCGLSDFKDNQRFVDIIFPPIILQKYENITALNFSEIEKVEKSSRIDFYKVWRPYEARKYTIANQAVIIYSIGWGYAKGYDATQSKSWVKNIVPVAQFIEGNDVMMHGQRFDFLQLL